MTPSSSTPKSGSALLLTLLVVSLLMVMVLSFTVYVRVELRAVENRIDLFQARQHAKLGMHLALAQLQRTAGADRRVTARAEILGVTGGNEYWTGVWSPDGSGSTSPTNEWLVSGNSPDPTNLGPSFIEILAATESDPALNVPSEEIRNALGERVGDYAYWISDEGVKISLNKTDQEKQSGWVPEERGLTDTEMEVLPQLTPGRFQNERLFPSSINWDNLAGAVMRTSSYSQLVFTGLSTSILESQRHRATWRSMGVLSNSEQGGLKQDLSFVGSTPDMDAFSKSSALQDWVQHRVTGGSLELIGHPSLDPKPLKGEPIFTVPIVLTEFGLYMRISRVGNSNRLQFQTIIRPELWNPNSYPVDITPVDTEDIIFEISGLPELTCTWISGTSNPALIQSGTFTVNPNTIQLDTFQSNVDNTEETQSIASTVLRINYSSGLLAPGLIYTPSIRGEGEVGVTIPDNTGINSDDYVEIQAPASLITLVVKNASGEILQEYTDIPFAEVDTSGRETPNDLLNGEQVKTRSLTEYQLVYYFRNDDETPNISTSSNSPIEDWFTEFDFRSLVIPPSWYDSIITIENPDEAALNSLFQSQPDLFHTFRSFPGFDIPVAPPVSIGSLQHLQFMTTPPYSVGNEWGTNNDAFGNPFNSYFDRYFFSTVPQNGTGYDPQNKTPLANTHLQVQNISEYPNDLSTIRSPFSSKHFLVDGSFNINSVDPLVWQAVLGSLVLSQWENNTSTSPKDLSYGIFRNPFGANLVNVHPQEDFPDYPEIDVGDKAAWYRDDSSPLWSNAFKTGMRELRNTELENLANEITNRILSRNLPFISIKELADSGILQDAIDATSINSVGTAANGSRLSYSDSTVTDRIPRNAPAFVSQADILQLIGPFISARSDTFVIRAYGNTLNGASIEAEQYCEALIQRTTEPLTFRDKSNPSTVEEDYQFPPDKFGRRYKIISFKWVTP